MKILCSKCSRTFYIPDNERQYKMCSECREYVRKAYAKRKEKVTPKPPPPKKKIRRPTTDRLVLKVREIEDYNAEHGTRYSYGRYMALKENGWLKYG